MSLLQINSTFLMNKMKKEIVGGTYSISIIEFKNSISCHFFVSGGFSLNIMGQTIGRLG